MEIVQGVHQIKIPLPGGTLDHVNAYVLQGDKGNVLIDTGFDTPETFAALREGLRMGGIGFKYITHIIITHIHPDHYGMAAKLKQMTGATVAFTETEEKLLESRYQNPEGLLAEIRGLLQSNGVPEEYLSEFVEVAMPLRDFVGMVSHEFRTPLAAILSSVDLLDSYGDRLAGEDKSELLMQIRTGVARMTGMIEQLLLTSRLETGSFHFAPVPHRVADLLVQVIGEVERAHPGAQRIAIDCDGLDAARQVDPQLLRHILVNLLGNALKYSPADSPVQCRLHGEGERLVITVTDRGIGIPPDDLPRLFETFHRGTNVGQVPGTGIGLYVVKACVDLHRGEIAVDSRPGEGTVFTVRLSAPPA